MRTRFSFSGCVLLLEAFQEGVGYGSWLHTAMDFEPLRDYLPFQELAEPLG